MTTVAGAKANDDAGTVLKTLFGIETITLFGTQFGTLEY
jgi:hypothetical protein